MRALRGFILSLDAMFSVAFLFSLMVFISGMSFIYSSPELEYQRIYYSGKDVMNIMETLDLGDVQELAIVQQMLQQGLITGDNFDNTILDAVGSLWAEGRESYATALLESVFNDVLNATRYGYEIIIEDTSIYLKNATSCKYKARLNTIASGYMTGEPVSGFVARAYLKRSTSTKSEYIYFGGYEGEGNITKIVELPDYDEIHSVYMEMDAGNSFKLYINDVASGEYSKTIENNLTADKWSIDNVHLSKFTRGGNTITIEFTTAENNYIGGGYMRIRYNISNDVVEPLKTIGENASDSYYFPGIKGIINLYSSIYVPGQLNSISAYLHFDSNYTIFFSVGNKTVYEGNGTTEQNITIPDANFSEFFNYDELSKKTIPVRIGLRNVSYTLSGRSIGDSVLSTDISGSMDDCAQYIEPYTCHYSCIFGGSKSCTVSEPSDCTGNACGGTCWWPYGHELDCNQSKLDIAKEAGKKFVDIVLDESIPGNRVGLNSYSTDIVDTENLTSDKDALYAEINEYTADGWTCICCGVEEAITMLNQQSNSSRRRSIVIMSDGETNERCYTASEDLNGDSNVDAKDDAIQSACNAYNIYGIVVYAVAFGNDADNETLQLMAECGNGTFYFSNSTELANTFRKIAEGIINGSYIAQTVDLEGNITDINTLYPDSCITFNYTSEIAPMGYGDVIFSFESKSFGELTGNSTITDNETGTKESWYYIAENTEPIEVMVTSYSSKYWTDRLYMKHVSEGNWTRVYWLGNFNKIYEKLGDPYIVRIPINKVYTGNNTVRIGTGTSPASAAGGSRDNKVIYKLRLGGMTQVGYNRPFSKANGSTVTIYYDIDGDNVADGSSVIRYGSNPDDLFDPENDAVDDSFMRLMDTLNFFSDQNPDGYGNGTADNPYDGDESNPIEFQISQDDIDFEFNEISGVPSLWGPAELEVRTWS